MKNDDRFDEEVNLPDDVEEDEPLPQVVELRDRANPEFFSMVQHRIERKDLTLNVLHVMFVMPLLFIVELTKAFMPDQPKDESGQGGPESWNKDST